MAPKAHAEQATLWYNIVHIPQEAGQGGSLGLMTVLMEVSEHTAGVIQLVPRSQTLFDLDLLHL